jgi:hypothetical protein
MYQIISDFDHRSFSAMTKAMGTVEYYFVFQLILNQKLLDYLNHFLVSARKTGASQAYSDLSLVFFHD